MKNSRIMSIKIPLGPLLQFEDFTSSDKEGNTTK